MAQATGVPVAQALERAMMKKALLIGGIASAAMLAGGSAFAQSRQGPDSFEPPSMHGRGPGGMGHGGMHGMHGGMGHGGMNGPMGQGMHGPMGQGMRGRMDPGMHGEMGQVRRGGMGPGMMGMNHGSATVSEHRDIGEMFSNHDRIKRTVTKLPDGIRTVTESDDPQLAETIKKHVTEMGKRVDEGRDPGLPIETPALHAIFRDKDKVKSTYEVTEKGIVVVQTSADSKTVAALQQHASEVTGLVKGGMAAAHAAMMENNGGMMHGGMMHGPMMDDAPDGDRSPNSR